MTRKGWIAVGVSWTLSCVLAIALVVVIALGDDEPSSEPTAPTAPTEALGESGFGAQLPEEVHQCLADQGVELPSPDAAPGELDVDALRQAMQECAGGAPAGVDPFSPG